MTRVIRCSACARRLRSMEGWNVTLKAGVIVGYTCPDCQTAEQNAEAEINQATTDYGTDRFGRITGKPMGTAAYLDGVGGDE